MHPFLYASLDLLLALALVVAYVLARHLFRDLRDAWREDAAATRIVALCSAIVVLAASLLVEFAPYVALLGLCVPLGLCVASGEAFRRTVAAIRR